MRAVEARPQPLLCGVILAAGASERMGSPKQLLPLGDRPLLQHVLDAAVGSRLDEIVLVLGHRAAEIQAAIAVPPGSRVRVVVNPDYGEGQSSSLRLGLRSTDRRAAAAAVLLGDQPHVGAGLIDRVAAAFLAAGAPVARPVYRGSGGRGLPGHPVFLARRVWPEVEKLHGDLGARAILAAHPQWVLEVAVEGEPPGDVNNRGDYQGVVRHGDQH